MVPNTKTEVSSFGKSNKDSVVSEHTLHGNFQKMNLGMSRIPWKSTRKQAREELISTKTTGDLLVHVYCIGDMHIMFTATPQQTFRSPY